MEKRTTNKLFALLLTIVMVLGLLPITAFAAESLPPTNLQWDGYKATWTNPVGETSFIAYLCKDGGTTGESIHAFAPDNSVDFTSEIQTHGNGSYTFKVQAGYNAGGSVTWSTTVESNAITVSTESETHKVTWDYGEHAKWESISNVWERTREENLTEGATTYQPYLQSELRIDSGYVFKEWQSSVPVEYADGTANTDLQVRIKVPD